MEKRGVVDPKHTRATEAGMGEKQAGARDRRQETKTLDDDFTKRAAETAANQLKTPGS